jgi:phage/plasmid-associated DNA primase
MELVENYKNHLDKIAYLYHNLDTLPIKNKEKTKLWLEKIVVNDGVLDVKYNRGDHPRYCAEGCSIQNIERSVCNFIFENSDYVEIDMSSAISNIMEKICIENDIEVNELKYYNRNRDAIIKKYYDGDKEKCKSFINDAFCSKPEWVKTTSQFEEQFLNEVKSIQNDIYDNLKYEHLKVIAIENQKQLKKDNFKGSTLSYIYSEMETQIVMKSINYYIKETGKEPFCYKYDGFIAPRVDETFIEELSKHTGFKFCIKEFVNKNIKYTPDEKYDLKSIKASYYINYLKKKNIRLNDLSDGHIADTALLLFGDDYVCIGDVYYVYHDNRWRSSTPGLINITMCNKLLKVYRLLVIHYNACIIKMDSETEDYKMMKSKILDINKLIDKLESNTGSNNVFSKFKNKLKERCDVAEFNKLLSEVVVFENTAFNVKTGRPYKVKKNDYNTFTTGYNYVKPTTLQINKIEKLFTDVFPNPEIRKCYLSILKSALLGIRLEKFIMAEGRGRNGKGMLNELLLLTLGPEYSYTGNITALTQKIKDGPNPELSALNLKRYVKFEEPNHSDKILLGNIKKYTGEGMLNARECHSNRTLTILLLTMIFECNNKPNLDGEIGDAEIERFILVLFETYFTADPTELKENPNAKPIDTSLKLPEVQKDLRCAFFDYIVKHGNNELYVPDCVKKRTREYLLENDDLFSFFTNTFEKTDEECDYITIKKIMYAFKNSEVFDCLTKQQRRKYTESKLRAKISENPELRKSFKSKWKNTDGITFNSVMLGWKKKQVECEIDSDSD